MKKLIVILLPIFLYVGTGCQGKDLSTPNESTEMWGNSSHGMRISIEIREPRFKIGQSAFAIIIIENVTNQKINYSSIPAFTFNNLQYWCPVDIVNEDSSLPVNTHVKLSLDENAFMKTRADLSKLKCEQGSSSMWPENTLYSILPIGKYILRLDIEVVDGGDNNWIRSNEVNVEISN